MHSIGVFLGKKSEVDADSKITKKLDLGSDIVKLFAHNVSRLGEGCLTDAQFSHKLNGSFCQTAVMCWAVYQH